MRDYNTTSFFLQLMNEKPKITDNNAEVIKMNVYIKVEESVCIDHKEIKMKDIMSLYCTDKDMEQQIKNKSIYHFIDRGNQRKCFSVLKVIEKIKEVDKTLDVINLGPQDFIVYYKKKQDIPSEELLKSEHCSKNHVEELGVRLTIEQAVRKLPEEIRETAVLYFFQELKQREIAELLHIKLSLVKYRIGRAKELLMKELEVKNYDEI